MNETVLPDTSLCAIVRDELMNPAGGIIAFAHATLPHVEAGVIIDTGSIDGTRDALVGLKTAYPHLQVFDRPFDDFASSRNHALGLVSTTYALVLDADEVIADGQLSIPAGYAQLARLMQEQPSHYYSFRFKDVQADMMTFGLSGNPRLFRTNGTRYVNYLGRHGEHLHDGYDKIRRDRCIPAETTIYHFRPKPTAHQLKWTDWYEALDKDPALQSSRIPSFPAWKEYNRHRELFRNH